jgi:hypothetical protein
MCMHKIVLSILPAAPSVHYTPQLLAMLLLELIY